MTDERPITMSSRSMPLIERGVKTQTRRLVNLDQLRIDLPARVGPDPGWVPASGIAPSFAAGRYRCRLNPQGAVIAIKGGDELGIKPDEFSFVCPYARGITHLEGRNGADHKVWTIHPYAGQTLWIREEWGAVSEHENDSEDQVVADAKNQMPWAGIVYGSERLFLHKQPTRWRRAMFMPRWASRRSLRPIVIRLERLHDMTEEDAVAEGVSPIESQDGLERTAREEFAQIWCEMHGADAWVTNPWVWATTFEKVKRLHNDR